MKNRKAQLELGNAPTVVLIVGLIFLTMATLAFMGEKYNNAIDTDNTAASATAEAVTQALISSAAGDPLSALDTKNGGSCVITAVTNGTAGGILIRSGNYTEVTDCYVKNLTNTFSTASWYVNYTYTYSRETVASNLTLDMNTELGNNSSIAGIILTISLVGIVLTILIGVFMGIKANRI